VSTAVHAILIALAVRATTLTAKPPEPPTITPVHYVPRRPDAPVLSPRATPSGPRTNQAVVPVPPAPFIAPVEIPTTIPATGTMVVPITEDAFPQRGGRLVDGPVGVTPNVSGDQPLTERYVDRAVVALPGGSPRYPSLLQSAGLEGDVRAQFVVDTLGRVEHESVRILESTHESFAQSVRDALLRARFVPAEAGGRKVRQLVEQPFSFRLTTR
jgi:protein TonB